MTFICNLSVSGSINPINKKITKYDIPLNNLNYMTSKSHNY